MRCSRIVGTKLKCVHVELSSCVWVNFAPPAMMWKEVTPGSNRRKTCKNEAAAQEYLPDPY
jgi:hypothetical protein